MREISARDRFRGCLLGLAAGDALGTTLEFKAPGTFEPIDDMVGGGPFKLLPGQWTDDTSMALCLAKSLIECGGFDTTDQMQRYLRWWREGYLSSTGRCFDIGTTVRRALSRCEREGDPYAGSSDPQPAGNGSLMRLGPVAMYFAEDAAEAVNRAADSSITTHGAQEAVDACRYFAGLLVGALRGSEKATLLSPGYCPVVGLWEGSPLAEEIARVAGGSFKDRNPPAIRGTGYVVATGSQSAIQGSQPCHNLDVCNELSGHRSGYPEGRAGSDEILVCRGHVDVIASPQVFKGERNDIRVRLINLGFFVDQVRVLSQDLHHSAVVGRAMSTHDVPCLGRPSTGHIRMAHVGEFRPNLRRE